MHDIYYLKVENYYSMKHSTIENYLLSSHIFIWEWFTLITFCE